MTKLLLLFLCLPAILHAQKQLSLTVHYPASLKQKLRVSYYTGKESRDVFATGDSIVVTDTFYTLHAVCTLVYSIDEPFKLQSAVYYADEKPALMRIKESDTSKNVFASADVFNLVDAGPLGVDEMKSSTAKEVADLLEVLHTVRGKQDPGDSVGQLLSARATAVAHKRFDYAVHHPELYFSFYSFSENLMYSRFVTVDSMIRIFYSFPQKFQNSYEGRDMMDALLARKLREEQMIAPVFSVKDINNDPVSLLQFRGKYVLMDFWASWCVGCIESFPRLDSFMAGIPAGELVKIYITEDKDPVAFERARKKYNRQGIHIFGTDRLVHDYRAGAIPQVCLIDPAGKIVYDCALTKDYRLIELAALLKKIWPKR